MDKEQLRQKRKEAYQKAKARRDADPQYQALKEKMKQARKSRYSAFKKRQKEIKALDKQKRIEEKDNLLKQMLIPASQLETK